MDETPTANNPIEFAADRSAVLIHVRSNVGPIQFATTDVKGSAQLAIVDGVVDLALQSAARLELDLNDLRSGNLLYDAELLRRVDADRYPRVSVELTGGSAAGGDRFLLTGALSFHGETRTVEGSVVASVQGERLVVDGEQTLDIRDFNVPTPSLLMLRIYPDVRVQFHVEAHLDADTISSS